MDDWDHMIDINIKGVLYGIAAALPHMPRQKAGHIINVSSVAGHKYPGRHRLCGDQARGAGDLRRAAAGGEALQHPHDRDLAGGRRHRAAGQRHRAGRRRGIQEFYEEIAIPADSFARAVAFAMSQPEDVDINEILFRPTRQEL